MFCFIYELFSKVTEITEWKGILFIHQKDLPPDGLDYASMIARIHYHSGWQCL
jgi:hypothetical protein